MKDLEALLIKRSQTLREALRCLDTNGEGIALVVAEGGKLLGTITDGDLRRATLAGLDVDKVTVDSLLRQRKGKQARPLTAPVGTKVSS